MSYSNPNRRTYTFPGIAFGTSGAQTLDNPKGKAGRIVSVQVVATVLFTAVTTPGRVDLGNSTTANAYGSLSLGTLAAAASLSSEGTIGYASYTNTTRDIAADVPLKVSFIAPTGGSPAGTGTVILTVDWDD